MKAVLGMDADLTMGTDRWKGNYCLEACFNRRSLSRVNAIIVIIITFLNTALCFYRDVM